MLDLLARNPWGEGGTWVNFCWVYAADLSEPLPHYSLFRGQLQTPSYSLLAKNVILEILS